MKKFLTYGVVIATIIWSLGIGAIVPMAASAAYSPAAGDIVKVAGTSAVYYINASLQRQLFSNRVTYGSWFANFDGLKTITATELSSINSGANVTVRPGTNLVKFDNGGAVYAVTPGAIVRPLMSGDVAKALYGADWAKKIVIIQVAFESNYTKGDALTTTSKLPDGSVIKYAGSDAVYYIQNGTKRLVTADAFVANRLSDASVITNVPTSMTYTDGASVTAKEDAIAGLSGTSVVPPVSGKLSVALSATQPTSITLPLGATNVDVLKFNITGGSSDVVIDEINVARMGVGTVTGLTAYLYDGVNRLASGKTFASDNNTATFGALNYTLKAGDSRTLTVRLSTGSTATTGNHTFTVSGISLAPAGTVTGLPVTGNGFAVNSGVSAGTVTIAKNGTLSNPTIGDSSVVVSQFRVSASGEDVDVSAITLKNGGDTPENLSNFSLYQGSTKLSTTVSVSGRYVAFTLNSPVRILDGNNKIFSVQADISANMDSAKTINFYMDQLTDLKAVGTAYGLGDTIANTDLTSGAQSLTTQGGDITISNKSQSAHDVKVDTTEVELGKVAITSKSDTVEVQKMTLRIATTKVNSGGDDWGTYQDEDNGGTYETGDVLLLRNIKLKDADTGRTLGSSKAITDCGAVDVDGALACVYTDYFSISKGTTKNIIAVADINSAQISGVKYTASFDFTSDDFTARDSKDALIAATNIVPSTIIASNQITTRASGLTISLASTPESQTVVKGSTVDALGMIFSATSGTGNDVKLSGLTLNTYVDADVDGTFVANTETETTATAANSLVTEVALYEGNTLVAATSSPDSNGKVIFNANKFVGGYYNIVAGSNKTLTARVVVSGNAPYGSSEDAFSFTFAAADVTVEANGTGFTPTVTGTNLNGTTAPSVSVQITASGSITTSIASDRPDAKVIIAGLVAPQEVSRINLHATKETYAVDKLAIQITNAAVDTTSNDNVESVSLYDSAGVQILAGGSPAVATLDSAGLATFTGLNITVLKNTDVKLIVKAIIKPIGERTTPTDGTVGQGADSGDDIIFNLSTASDSFHAVGTSGATDIAANAAVGSTMVIRKALPELTYQALPNTSLGNGTNKVLLRFSITANTNPVYFKGLQPLMTATDQGATALNVSNGTVVLYDVTNGNSTQLNTSAVNMSAFIPIDTALIPVINVGQTKVFEIKGTIVGADTAGETLETSIVKDSAALSGITEIASDAIADGANNFIWSDGSADTYGVGSVEWVNSFKLPTWPAASAMMSR